MTPDELRRRRQWAGMTQEQLAALLVPPVTARAVSTWEQGTRRVPARREATLLRVLPEAPPHGAPSSGSSTAEWDSGGVLILSWH